MDIPETSSADRATTDADRSGLSITRSILRSTPEIATVSIFAALALLCAWFSDGFVAADACTHFLFAKYAFADPVNFVDVWGRPLCTLIDSVPAQLGLFAVRVTHVVIAVACASRRPHDRTKPIPPPSRPGTPFHDRRTLFFLFSFSEMTELPFALMLGLAFVCY